MTRTSFRILTVLALALGALSFAAVSSAGDGDGHGSHGEHHKSGTHGEHQKKSEHHGNVWRFSTTLTSTDSGTCHVNDWNTEVIKRTYTVSKGDNGVYTVRIKDRGTFTTIAGDSPGKCETRSHHGSVVTAGITGRMGGRLSSQVLGSTTFNPNATCTATDCFRADFLKAFFGPTATYSCDTDQACKYVYVYHSKDPALKYHSWLDAGVAKDGVLKAVNRGDIATA
jgi:hypothetical protein